MINSCTTNNIRGFPAQTEVKTDHGWKAISMVDPEKDRLLSADPVTRSMSYLSIGALSIHEYNGPITHLKGPRVDLSVLDGMPIYTHRETKANGKFSHKLHFRKIPQDMVRSNDGVLTGGFEYPNGNRQNFILPSITITRGNKKVIVPQREINMEAWLEFFGFWLADGCCRGPRSNGTISYSVYIKQNESNEEYVLSLIRGIGFEPKIEHYQAGGYNNYCIQNRQLWEYLRRFGRSADKYIPDEFLSLAPEYLHSLFRGYINGDSTRDKKSLVLSSISKRLIDNIQELVLKLYGRIVQIREDKKKRPNGSVYSLWVLQFVPERKIERANFGEVSVETYTGLIYDFGEAKDGLILLRNNGRVMWAAC